MAERKMADALDELYNDGVKAKMKDFIIENIDTIVAQLAGKYLTQSDAQSQFASINSALSGKLGTTAKAASATTADSASKVTGGTITLSGDVTGSGSFNSAGNVTINTSGGGTTYSTGTASTAGIKKLYTSTGSSTDGTMTRQAITNELNNKANSSALSNYATTSALDSLQSTVNNKANASDLNNKLDTSTWDRYFAESSILYYKLGTLGLQEGTGVIITTDNNDTFTVVLQKHNVRFNFTSDGLYLNGKKITN